MGEVSVNRKGMIVRTTRRFPLGLRLTLSREYQHSADFARVLALARENDLAGQQLNIVDLDDANPVALKELLKDFGFSITRLASFLSGFGQLDFARIFRLLVEGEYAGSLVLEGNTRGSMMEDLPRSFGFMDRQLDTVG